MKVDEKLIQAYCKLLGDWVKKVNNQEAFEAVRRLYAGVIATLAKSSDEELNKKITDKMHQDYLKVMALIQTIGEKKSKQEEV